MDALLEMTEPWAYILVGLLALAESAAFVGLIAPGEATLILAGVLVSRGHAHLAWMVASASAGAVIGDSISYEIGRRFGPRLLDSRLARRIGPQHWARADRYLSAHGAPAVFLGRFIGLIRPLVPAAAGVVRLPYRTFLVANVAGGVLWATGSVLIGVAAGESWPAVEGWFRYASLGLGVAVAVALTLGGAVWWARRNPRWARSMFVSISPLMWLSPVPVPRGWPATKSSITRPSS